MATELDGSGDEQLDGYGNIQGDTSLEESLHLVSPLRTYYVTAENRACYAGQGDRMLVIAREVRRYAV